LIRVKRPIGDLVSIFNSFCFVFRQQKKSHFLQNKKNLTFWFSFLKADRQPFPCWVEQQVIVGGTEMLSIKTESKKLRQRKHKSIFSFISISLCGITAYLFLPFLLSFGFPLLSFLFSYLLLSSSFLYIYIVVLLERFNVSFFLSSSFIISANLPIFFIYLLNCNGH
jgi:hypothetical protein